MAIRDFKNEIEDNEGITEYFRECKKYLNHYAAVTTLEFLDSNEIRDLAFNYMMKLREEKQNGSGGTGPKSRKKKKNNPIQTTVSSFHCGFSVVGVSKSLRLFFLKTDGPFVRIFAELNRGDTRQGRLM